MKVSLNAALALILFLAPAAAADDSLFQALGGRETIQRIAAVTIDLSVADPRINATFADINHNRIKRLLADQFCQLSGGPCVYEGRDMKETHAKHGYTNADFNILVEHLQTAMDREKIPFRVQNRLLALLAPMQRDIVTK